MKLDIVPRRRTKKEKGNLHREGRHPNREQRRPSPRRARPRSARFSQRRFRPAGLSQTHSPCSKTLDTRGRNIINFNPDLTLLKSSRNGLPDRKSTRLNSSHLGISYAVFCLKKKKI